MIIDTDAVDYTPQDMDELRAALAKVEPGDKVAVVLDHGHVLHGKVALMDHGSLTIRGRVVLRYQDGSPASAVVRLIGHEPKPKPKPFAEGTERTEPQMWDVVVDAAQSGDGDPTPYRNRYWLFDPADATRPWVDWVGDRRQSRADLPDKLRLVAAEDGVAKR